MEGKREIVNEEEIEVELEDGNEDESEPEYKNRNGDENEVVYNDKKEALKNSVQPSNSQVTVIVKQKMKMMISKGAL